MIGRIKKGGPKPENAPGKDLTYFRYVPVGGEESAAAKFAEVYGDEPREIIVFLPFDDIDRNFETAMELHTAGALQCKGDIEGGGAFMWRDSDGVMQHTHKPCPDPPCNGCKEGGYLRAIIPALVRYASVEVSTHSKWDIIELYGNLRAIQMTEGGLTGIPMVLKRRPRDVSTPRKGGKRVRQIKWLLSLEVAPRYVEEKLAALQNGDAPPAPQIEATVDTATDEITGEWDGELFDQNEPEVDESPADDTSPAVQAAMDYTTDSGAVLGKLGPDELVAMVDKIDGLPRPTAKMKTIKGHCLTLLEYLKQFEQK